MFITTNCFARDKAEFKVNAKGAASAADMFTRHLRNCPNMVKKGSRRIFARMKKFSEKFPLSIKMYILCIGFSVFLLSETWWAE